MTAPIERTTRYVTSVDDLSEAWAFVMSRIDSVGRRPRVVISPVTIFSHEEITEHDGAGREIFEVVVEGMEEVEP